LLEGQGCGGTRRGASVLHPLGIKVWTRSGIILSINKKLIINTEDKDVERPLQRYT
jgi:hypothetical protein